MDCSCVAGGRLAVFCIEIEKVTYVEKNREGSFLIDNFSERSYTEYKIKVYMEVGAYEN